MHTPDTRLSPTTHREILKRNTLCVAPVLYLYIIAMYSSRIWVFCGIPRTSCDVTVQLICQKREANGAVKGHSFPRQSVCTVNWHRIGGLGCNSTGKLSAFQTSLYAGRTHTSPFISLLQLLNAIRRSLFVTPAALKASTSYPYFSTRIIILTALTY